MQQCKKAKITLNLLKNSFIKQIPLFYSTQLNLTLFFYGLFIQNFRRIQYKNSLLINFTCIEFRTFYILHLHLHTYNFTIAILIQLKLMRGIHTQIDGLTTHLTKSISQDQIKTSDSFNMIFQKMIFQSLKLVNIIFDEVLTDYQVKNSFQKFVKQLKAFAKKRPQQQQSEDQFFHKEYDEMSQFLNNRKPVMSNDDAQRGDIYKFLSQVESKEKDMKQFMENTTKFAGQKKMNRFLQSSKKFREIETFQKECQTDLQFQEMNKLEKQIEKVQQQKITLKMMKNRENQTGSKQEGNVNADMKQNSPQKINGLNQETQSNQLKQRANSKTQSIANMSQKKLQTSPRNQKSIQKNVNGNFKKSSKKASGRSSLQVNNNQFKKVGISNFKDKSGQKQKQKQKQLSSNTNLNSNSNIIAKKSKKVINEGDQVQNDLLELRSKKDKINQNNQNNQGNKKITKQLQLQINLCEVSTGDFYNQDKNGQAFESSEFKKKEGRVLKQLQELVDMQIQTDMKFFTEQQAEIIWKAKQKQQQKDKKNQKRANSINKQRLQDKIQNENQQKRYSEGEELQKNYEYLNYIQSRETPKNSDKNKDKDKNLDLDLQHTLNTLNDLKQNKYLNHKSNKISELDEEKRKKLELAYKNTSMSMHKFKNGRKINLSNNNDSQKQNQLTHKISLPSIKKSTNFSSIYVENDNDNDNNGINMLNSYQNVNTSSDNNFMKKVSNSKSKSKDGIKNQSQSQQIKITHQENRIMKQLERFVSQNSVKTNIKTIFMYIQFFQTLHARQCGQKCIHLNRFLQFLKKKNIPTRKELMLHKADISKTTQF